MGIYGNRPIINKMELNCLIFKIRTDSNAIMNTRIYRPIHCRGKTKSQLTIIFIDILSNDRCAIELEPKHTQIQTDYFHWSHNSLITSFVYKMYNKSSRNVS